MEAVTRVLLRCLQCAGEPVPEDLPVAPLVQPKKPLGMQPLRLVAKDWKQKAAQDG